MAPRNAGLRSSASAASVGYRKILVGYDGSTNAKRALERAAVIALAVGAELRIVVVVNPVLPAYGPVAVFPDNYAGQIEEGGRRSLREAMKIASRITRKVYGSVEQGHAAQAILDAADNQSVDVIVLGRRGTSAIERFVMGGVSSSIINHSKCDVLIVK